MTGSITLFPTVADGLSAELDMFEAVVAGTAPASAFLWEAEARGLVLPERFARSDRFADAARESAAAGWPVETRRTGGGITPQGPGVLNLALAFRLPPGRARAIRESYGAICDPLIAACAGLGVHAGTGAVRGSFCDGDYNLEAQGRKFVGTAQRWRGTAVLCHALILTDLELAPAVTAAQRLSDGLGFGDAYDAGVHTRLSDLAPGVPSSAIALAIWGELAPRYAHWKANPARLSGKPASASRD